MTIYTNSVMNSVYTTLSSNQTIVNSNVAIDRYAILNTNPEILYWLNIMQPTTPIEPWRSNTTLPWKATYNITIQAQVQNLQGIAQQYLSVMDLIQLQDNVFNALNANRTLDNTVDIITDFTLDILDRDDNQSDDFLLGTVRLNAEVFV